MGIKAQRSNSRSVRLSCTPQDPCIKCSLLKVASHRFKVFVQKFGRQPTPDEPLFFDPESDQPVFATDAQIRRQLIAAASATGVSAARLMRFLGLH
ncbi:MAG: hypothetical protein ACLQU2_11125 [Candidatus Binataceae bacterium]